MGLDNLPEVPPCENLIKKYPGKAEVVDIPIEYISSEFISSITSREENIGENFEILKHYFPEYHMKVYTVNGKVVICHPSICPFKLISHTIGVLGALCWLRGKVYNYIIEGVSPFTLYDDLEPEDIKSIYYILKHIVEQKSMIENKNFYQNILLLTGEEIDENTVNIVADLFDKLRVLYDQWYQELLDVYMSDEYEEYAKMVLKTIIETDRYVERDSELSSVIKGIHKKYEELIDEVLREVCKEVTPNSAIEHVLCDYPINYIIQVLELYYYFRTLVSLDYDKKLIAWY